MSQIIFAVMALLVPALILWLVSKVSWAQKLGAVLICYVLGIIVGNSGLISAQLQPIQMTLSQITVVLALPMLLFAFDVRGWFKLAGKALISLLIAVISVVSIASALFFVFSDIENGHEMAGLAVGVYTGGTPNLAAIKAGLGVAEERYLIFHMLDTLVGGIYILFMISFGRPLFSRFLGAYQTSAPAADPSDSDASGFTENFADFLSKQFWFGTGKALLVSVLIVAISVGLASLVKPENNGALVIILLTSLGLAASFVPVIRNNTSSYRSGMYLIYVFSFVVATMADFSNFNSINLSLLAYVVITVLGSLLVHAVLCKLFNVDTDTFMVTSVACICSPPFVPLLSRVLNNPAVILSGFTTGVIGYAVGNYLGISIGLVLANLT